MIAISDHVLKMGDRAWDFFLITKDFVVHRSLIQNYRQNSSDHTVSNNCKNVAILGDVTVAID